jgi:hypothetical protein
MLIFVVRVYPVGDSKAVSGIVIIDGMLIVAKFKVGKI